MHSVTLESMTSHGFNSVRRVLRYRRTTFVSDVPRFLALEEINALPLETLSGAKLLEVSKGETNAFTTRNPFGGKIT